jgi:hypothetical protein
LVLLRAEVAALLALPASSVIISAVNAGSVRISLLLPPAAANALIALVSDGALTSLAGFAVQGISSTSATPAPLSRPCSSLTQLTAQSGLISSGAAPYEPNMRCTWIIQAQPFVPITLFISSFSLEGGYDYVKVFDGASVGSGNQIAALTGNLVLDPIRAFTGSMLIQFVSDGSIQAAGFNGRFSIDGATVGSPAPSVPPSNSPTATAVDVCNGTLTVQGDSGTITDGSGAGVAYAVNKSCSWLVPFGATISFSNFDLEQGRDFLKV